MALRAREGTPPTATRPDLYKPAPRLFLEKKCLVDPCDDDDRRHRGDLLDRTHRRELSGGTSARRRSPSGPGKAEREEKADAPSCVPGLKLELCLGRGRLDFDRHIVAARRAGG